MALYRNDSHLAGTKTNPKYTELYEPTNQLFNNEIKKVTIKSQHDRRPDLAAQDILGNHRLWWIFMHFNPDTIKDPVADFTAGKIINIPKQQSSSSTVRL
tara:strand:- start:408 stop:707 length:300 start_codon:yes stop_codon:yes gene_type:complete